VQQQIDPAILTRQQPTSPTDEIVVRPEFFRLPEAGRILHLPLVAAFVQKTRENGQCPSASPETDLENPLLGKEHEIVKDFLSTLPHIRKMNWQTKLGVSPPIIRDSNFA
jgi:hypothetical protein